MWTVKYLAEAEAERNALPAAERIAIQHAVEKLQALGPRLPFPHSADARASARCRELRPRAGRCPWRPLYTRAGQIFVIAAIAPDGETDPRGFARACAEADERLAKLEDD